MKIKLSKNDFIYVIDLISGVAKENKIRPIISGILIEAENNQLKFTGTDLEQTIVINIDGEIIIPGKIVLDHRECIEYIKLVEEEEIIIETEENMIKINNAKFSTFNYEEYPVINIEEGEKIIFNRLEFLNSIKKVNFASSKDMSNLAITGIRVDNDKIVATDTYRMIVDEVKKTNITKTIPFNSVVNLIKILEKNGDKEINILNYDHFGIEINNIKYITRIIDLSFPDYNSIIQNTINSNTNEIHINSKNFLKTLKKVNTVVSKNIEYKNAAKFEIKLKEVVITGFNQKSKIKEKQDITNINGIEIETSLNVKFLMEYIINSEKEVTIIKFDEFNKPFIINNEYLIMPITLK